MNKLPAARRVRIFRLFVEGMSLRAITRAENVSINTVTKRPAPALVAAANRGLSSGSADIRRLPGGIDA